MKTTYTIIRADGSTEKIEVELSNNKQKRAEQTNAICRPVVDGWLEIVHVFWEGSYTYMVVDEEGKLKGKPFNAIATAIYWNNVRVHQPEEYDKLTDYIAGDAVLFKKGVVT